MVLSPPHPKVPGKDKGKGVFINTMKATDDHVKMREIMAAAKC